MLTALDIKVTIIDQRPTLLDFVDREMIEALSYHMRQRGATFRLGEKVTVGRASTRRGASSRMLESGKTVHGGALLYTVGRQANSDLLELAAAGLAADARGRIPGRRVLSDGRAAHLRRGRRDRLSRRSRRRPWSKAGSRALTCSASAIGARRAGAAAVRHLHRCRRCRWSAGPSSS